MRADVPDCLEHHDPAAITHEVCRLVHQFMDLGDALGIGFDQPAAWEIVVPVDQAFLTMETISVAGEGDEVGQRIHSLTVAVW
ncbi:MAG: hypothetical protein ABSB15_21075 [Bryobacteraceae bacterium]|jgi:hypothetical protein